MALVTALAASRSSLWTDHTEHPYPKLYFTLVRGSILFGPAPRFPDVVLIRPNPSNPSFTFFFLSFRISTRPAYRVWALRTLNLRMR